MPQNRQLAKTIVTFLNGLLGEDPRTIRHLIETRVECSKVLASHPTVQVAPVDDDTFFVGMLGILNGMCGVDENNYGPIAAVYEHYDDNRSDLVRFEVREEAL